jgi:hypothetical protein
MDSAPCRAYSLPAKRGDERMKMTARSVLLAAVLALVGPIFGGAAAFAQLTGDDRTQFIQGSFGACNDAAKRDHPEIAADAVKTYCQCMAEKEADMTTQADIDYVNAHQAGSDDYKARILALAPACQAKAGLK